jgi:TusA-related sulfurtransferase
MRRYYSYEKAHMKTIDVTREHCPMTYVKVKIALEEIDFGETLDVLLSPGEPLENIPKNAREEGNRVLEIREDNGNYHVVIEKRGYINKGCGGACHGK